MKASTGEGSHIRDGFLGFFFKETLSGGWIAGSAGASVAPNLSLKPIIKQGNERIQEAFLLSETGVQPAENVSSFDLR